MLPYEITLITGSDFDIDKMYLMLKELPIKRKKNIKNEMLNAVLDSRKAWYKSKGKTMPHSEINEWSDRVNTFLSNPLKMSRMGNEYTMLAKWYRNNAFECEVPLQGRSYRNNKIVDMTYSVLTHPDIAAQVLKPGGFEPQKRVAYTVEALRLGYSLEEVQNASTSDLKDMCETDKDLTTIGTHVQFYKQNSAAAALLPIFATAKIAHAVLAGNGYTIDINEVCRTNRQFYLDGQAFGGLMEFDAQQNSIGQFIGNDLGSCVAGAADAVKDPVYNFMNININTVNILNAMMRMGVPFETAALVLSSKVVGNVLNKYNMGLLGKGYKSFVQVLNEELVRLNEEATGTKNGSKVDSQLDYENLSKEELYKAVTGNNNSIDYKILNTIVRFSAIANALKTPSAISKLNSINSAVGPLVIDNMMMDDKLTTPMTGLYYKGGDLTMEQIFRDHPILEKFYGAYQLANNLFSTISTAGSNNFDSLMRDTSYSDALMRNRKLLNKYVEFYQSYLAMVGGVVDVNELAHYVNNFPATLSKLKKDPKYQDNALIQALKFTVQSDGRVAANIDTTNMDNQQKTVLSSAWIDLYKLNPDVALGLFKYSFFRGGIGFSPKTIMNLLPLQIKEKIPGYVETYTSLPSTEHLHYQISKQFIQNNYKDNTLVPIVSYKDVKQDSKDATVFYTESRSAGRTGYIKVENKGVYDLYQVRSYDNESEIFVLNKIPTLGNNGEFIEISESDITSLLEVTKDTQQALEVEQVEGMLEEADNVTTEDLLISEEQISDDLLVLATLIKNQLSSTDAAKMEKLPDIAKTETWTTLKPKMIQWFTNKAQENGVTVNEKEAEQMLNLFC